VNRDERTDQVVRQLARLEDVIEVASESDGRAAVA
jgi:acetolactate synthase small subunit